jgi:hypothetical protein
MPRAFFMDIITHLPRFSDGEIDRALIKEIKTGYNLKRAMETEREKICAQHAVKVKNSEKFAIKGLGKCVSVMPAWEWFNLRQKYGKEAMGNREFLRDFQKRFPHLAPNKL